MAGPLGFCFAGEQFAANLSCIQEYDEFILSAVSL